MKGLGNDEKIVYIEIHNERPYKHIKYYDEEVNFWGKVVRKAGFFSSTSKFSNIQPPSYMDKYTVDIDLLENYFLMDNGTTIMEKAHIVIEYVNLRREKIYFNSNDEMIIFIKREFQDRKWRMFD